MSQNCNAVHIIVCITLSFTALSLTCAVWIGRRRDTPADPFSIPFGEMPGFSAEQLARIAPPVVTSDPLRRSFATKNQLKRDAEWLWRLQPDPAGLALRTDADGGRPVFASWLASIGNFFKVRRHA